MKNIPFLLIYCRLVIGIVISLFALFRPSYYEITIVFLMILGLLTDVFDGIIARKLNVSSEKLRVWDSNVDLIFWLCVIGSIFYLNAAFVLNNVIWLGSVIFLELLCYLFSFLKFKKSIATHSILAKFWTLTLLAFLIDLILNSASQIPFIICIAVGIISRLEIFFIIYKLHRWTTDVPSIFAVDKINQGIPLKKGVLF